MTTTADRVLRPARVAEAAMRLRDGRRVRLRVLRCGDEEEAAAMFAAAPPGDLRRRFLGQPPPMTRLIERLTNGDGVHDLALGAFDDDGHIVAIAQFDRGNDAPTAEFAIEVATDWQHDHLGTVMLRRLGRLARDAGIARFSAIFFADNLAIQRLLRHNGDTSATSYADGEGVLSIDLSTL